MRCKSRFFWGSTYAVVTVSLLVRFVAVAQAAVGVEGGLSSEYLSVSVATADGDKKFALSYPIGLALGVDSGDMADALHPVAGVQLQVPGSFARLESTKWHIGARYYLGLPGLSQPDSDSPFVMQTRSSRLYFLHAAIVYQRLFAAYLDNDGLPQSFDRAAAGLGFGVGGDFFSSWLSVAQSEWRFADDRRLRFRAVADLAVSVLSFGFYSTSFQSASLKLMLFKPL